MSKPRGQIRRSQVITTFGPGALIDLPRDSAIVAGIDDWPRTESQELKEPRVQSTLRRLTGVADPRLYMPPVPDPASPWKKGPGIDAYLFPEWYVVQQPAGSKHGAANGRKGKAGRLQSARSRRLVRRSALKGGKLAGRPVVATRFVRACPRGHVADIDWHEFVHRGATDCVGHLSLVESGETGELANLRVHCGCGKSRSMTDANDISQRPFGKCTGARPWLGPHSSEDCDQISRLLIRTATNAWFSVIVRALSIPGRGDALARVVREHWDKLQIVDELHELQVTKKFPGVAAALDPYEDAEVLEAILAEQRGPAEREPLKAVEIAAMLSAPEGFGDDIPVDRNFHARRLPAVLQPRAFDGRLSAVVQVHRLREVMALAGFTRLEAETPDIDGQYDSDVRRAELALEPEWFPAVETRGEGVLLAFDPGAIQRWRERPSVVERGRSLMTGYEKWAEDRKHPPAFVGVTYVMLHTFSHMLLQSLADGCGYPAASIRERIYVDEERENYGVLLYTSSPDAEGTLGGLVHQARRIGEHIERALASAKWCSNDPICSQHSPSESNERRWLQGAACHGCVLVAETSCEMWNDFLDRALVVPTLTEPGSSFFPSAREV